MDYSKMSDEDLYARYLACDRRALEELYDRYTARLIGFFLAPRFRFSRKDAWDSAHDVWIRVIETKPRKGRKRRPPFDPKKGSLPAWLFGIAWNEARNNWKKRGPDYFTGFSPEGDDGGQNPEFHPVDPGKTPEEIAITKENNSQLHRCNSALDELEQLAVRLWLLGEWSIEVYCKMTGVSPSKATRVKEAAFEKLRHCVETDRLKKSEMDEVVDELRGNIRQVTEFRDRYAASPVPASDDELIDACMSLQYVLYRLKLLKVGRRIQKKSLKEMVAKDLKDLWSSFQGLLAQGLSTEIRITQALIADATSDQQALIGRFLWLQDIVLRCNSDKQGDQSVEDTDSGQPDQEEEG